MDNATREKLITAAIPLFAEKGYAAVSIREIAAAAGVNVASISYYFRGKEALYHTIVEEQISTISRATQSVGELPPEERLKFYAQTIGEIHSRRPYVTRFMQNELANPTSAMEKVLKKNILAIYHFLYQTIQDGVDAGLFKPDLNVGHAALSLAGIMNFYFIAKPVFREFRGASPDSDSAYINQAVAIFLAGIRRTNNG